MEVKNQEKYFRLTLVSPSFFWVTACPDCGNTGSFLRKLLDNVSIFGENGYHDSKKS